MTKKFQLFVATLLLSVSNLFAAVEPVNSRVQGTDLYALSPAGTHALSDNKFWMVDAGIWQTDHQIQSVKNKIIFGIDESELTYFGSTYSYRITVDIDYQELVNNVLVPKTFTGVELNVWYDPARGSIYQDRDVFAFTGGLDVIVTVQSIEVESAIGSNSYSAAGSIPDALFLETEIITERFYKFNPGITPPTAINLTVIDDQLKVSWPFMEGAEQYDLEWAWVSTYSGTAGSPLGAGAVNYNFNEDATRVRLSGQNSYNIPLIYGEGFIVVRYRGVGQAGTNFTVPMEGSWSNATSGLVSGAANYIGIDAHIDDEMNYGAGMSFIENGVHSVGVTYMDGVLKARQSQAQLNSQDKIIVGSTIYDHHGRPAIGVMSTPVDQSTLGYVDDLNMYGVGEPFEKQHFDLDQELVPCEMNPAPGMDPVTSAGAANYYSPENPDQEGYNAYLPDAEGYPFVQVQYTPDPTGRIKKVGGVGPDHQLGNTAGGDAHFTEYFYTTPDDDELWALFGNDAARVENYTKVITKDVHGQISCALIDGMGRTVATYMEGSAPVGLDEIEGNNGPSNTGKDFMPYNQNTGDGILQVQTPIVITDPTQIYTFNYDFTGATFNECLPEEVCYDCVYELEISIIPAAATAAKITDGGETPDTLSNEYGIYTQSFIVGNIEAFDTDCDEPLVFSEEFPGAGSFEVKFECISEYYVVKTLKVSGAPIAYYWEQYQEQSICLLTYDDFLETAVANIDWTQCDEMDPCVFTFLQENGTEEEWIAANEGMDEEDYADRMNAWIADCGTISSCDIILPMLLQDVSPGGQYGATALPDDLSVFDDTGNELGGDWSTLTYYNEDGSPSYVDSDGDGDEDDLPTSFADVDDFLAVWQDSWANALIALHPEYCYYSFCVAHPEIADYEHDLFAIDNYDDACTFGYVNPAEDAGYFDWGPCVTDEPDPIFDVVLFDAVTYQPLIDDVMNADFGGFTIYEMAVGLSGDDPSIVDFGEGCKANEHWKMFQKLYQSKRFQVIDLLTDDWVAENCPFADCVAEEVAPCDPNPFDESSKRHFDWESSMGFDLAELDNLDWETMGEDNIAPEMDSACFNMCEQQAINWMNQLAGCDDLLTGEDWQVGDPTYDSVYYHLIKVCSGGCLSGCYNLSQENPDVATDTANHVFGSFDDVLTYWLGDDTTYCSYLLVTNPLPGPCEPVSKYLAECSCDLLLASLDAEAFETANGFTPANYDMDKCNCIAYDLNENDNIDGAEISALIIAEVITSTDYGCPKTCLDCKKMGTYMAAFNAEYDLLYYENPNLFTAYINSIN